MLSRENIRLIGQLSTVGLSFVFAIVLGFGGGYYLDGWLGTKPWFMFLGFFVGLAAGIINVYRVMQLATKPPDPRHGTTADRRMSTRLPLEKALARNLAVACAAMAVAAVIWGPQQPRLALGVIGGGVLAGVALWGLIGVARSLQPDAKNGEIRRVSARFSLVKFFTRYVILGLGAYVMMVRLRFDPVGMLVGVTSVVVAAAVAAARPREQFKRRR